MRSRHDFAQVQHRILHSIHASHEFKQNRQHPIQNPQIEDAVALHFIHLFETTDAWSIVSLSTGSGFTSKSIFIRELSDAEGTLSVEGFCSGVEGFLSDIVYITYSKSYGYTNSYSVIVRIPCFKQSNTCPVNRLYFVSSDK